MFRFGRSAVDVPSRTVLFDGESRHLEPQAFDLLAYLLAHRDRVVAKTELLDEVWGDQFVSESALTTRIKEVRRAVGDDGTRQATIKNFRGRGYRFVGDVEYDAGHDSEAVAGRSRPVVTSLMGRDDDIAQVHELLDNSSLVSLVGPGGVGKTTLARDVAAGRRELHTDGVFVARLASVRDPDALRHELRRETGLDEAGTSESDLTAAIADLDALLVLDNCEHLVGEAARLVTEIMERGGRLHLLTTSRERLGHAAERVWPVRPLDETAARRLLVARAQAAQPGFELPAGSDNDVSELLARLDRLPLAIEMAAARLPSVGLDDLLELLHDRLDLLSSADRGAEDRHRTINDLIGWSEQLLDARERDVLTCVSAFAGPAIAEDIAAVAQVDPTELAAGPLANCVDHSLVVVDTLRQPSAYQLLETVRASAARRRTPAHEMRHADRIIDIATEMDCVLRTADEPRAARRLDALQADLRIAHRCASEEAPERAGELTASLIHYAYERQWIEPPIWAERLLVRLPADHPGALAASAMCAADLANQGDFARASELAEPALASDDPRVLYSAIDTLANIGIYIGDRDRARSYLDQLRALGDDIGDATIQAAALIDEMMLFTYDGQPDEALDLLERRGRPPATASPTARAWVTYIEADSLAAAGRHREAIERFDEAIRLGTSVGGRFVVSVARLSSLATRSRHEDVDDALAAFASVLRDYRRVRSFTHAVTTLRNLVELLVRAGDDETAMILFGALSNPDVKATYGSESLRLDEARSTVESRTDDDDVVGWIARGARHDVLWAVDHAISVLS